jgi:Zn-dependent M28 family amino/carboxypeptidase
MMFSEVGNYFKQHRLEHTRLVIISFDGEECGLRGSRAFWQRHAAEFRATPTFHLNSDCPYYHDHLKFLTRDVNLTIPLDKRLAQECADVARSLGFDATICPIAFFAGATDAGEAARAGIRCTSMLSLPFTNAARPTVYHTIDDVVSSIEPKAIAQAISVALRWTQGIDQGIYGK